MASKVLLVAALLAASAYACTKSPSTQYWKNTSPSSAILQPEITAPEDFYTYT